MGQCVMPFFFESNDFCDEGKCSGGEDVDLGITLSDVFISEGEAVPEECGMANMKKYFPPVFKTVECYWDSYLGVQGLSMSE